MVGRHFVAYANFKATIQRFTGIAVDGRTESPKKTMCIPQANLLISSGYYPRLRNPTLKLWVSVNNRLFARNAIAK